MNKRKRIKWLKLLLITLLPAFLVSCGILLVAMDAEEQAGDEINIARAFEIPGDYLLMAYREAEVQGYDFIKLLTLSADAASDGEYNRRVLNAAIDRYEDAMDEEELELYEIYTKQYACVKASPIPEKSVKKYEDEEGGIKVKATHWRYTHSDDFGADRYYEEERRHYGNDLIADKNTPIVSMTDGTVTNMGWNELGGWRIGITDENATYWYYAHMDHYSDYISKGDWVEAGTIIGYVGNTGYGPPGTSGKFIDHLHLQIGISLDGSENDEYLWINPYSIVVFMEPYRVVLEEDD